MHAGYIWSGSTHSNLVAAHQMRRKHLLCPHTLKNSCQLCCSASCFVSCPGAAAASTGVFTGYPHTLLYGEPKITGHGALCPAPLRTSDQCRETASVLCFCACSAIARDLYIKKRSPNLSSSAKLKQQACSAAPPQTGAEWRQNNCCPSTGQLAAR